MTRSRFRLSRRSLLKGATIGASGAVALPILDAMLDRTGESYADGAAIPKRFGFWFWGTGIVKAKWVPSSTGAGYAPSEALQPFADAGVLDAVSTATGMSLPGSEGNNHHYGYRLARTGSATLAGQTYVQDLLDPVWQVAADHIAGDTPFSFVEMGVSQRGFQNSKKSGPEYSPSELFNMLFGNAMVEDPAERTRLELRASAVDTAWGEARKLRDRVGARDRERLEAHLDALASINNRLSTLEANCGVPVAPGEDAAYDANHEPLAETNEVMADMLVAAMACDLTRVFRYFLTGMQTDTVFWQAGNALGHHVMTHDEPQPQEGCHRSVQFMMAQLAYLLKRMRGTTIGAGTLLDHVAIVGTSELGQTHQHARNDIPMLVCGKAGGNLRGGVHHASSGENVLKGHLTALRAVGANVQRFGQTGAEPGALRGEDLSATSTIAAFES